MMGNSLQQKYEDGQYRIGYTLWAKPDVYITNSPIFRANQVTTPLLIMHNKGDKLVPWTQSVQFYTALRRLQKKVWMLQYDEGGHGVRGTAGFDFTIRITQFFDHYLKGYPAPRWMTQGIPAKLKVLMIVLNWTSLDRVETLAKSVKKRIMI